MPHEGQGNELKKALDDAWEKVPPDEKGKWHDVEISVKGTNPINAYRVVLTAQGG